MAFLLGVFALLTTVVAASVLMTLGSLHRDRTLGKAGLLLFSLGLFQTSMVVTPLPWPYLLSGVAGLLYVGGAPTFYHEFLGLPLGPRLRWIYAALWGAFLTLTVLGLEPARLMVLLPGILVLFFGIVVWGLVLIARRLRSPVPLPPLTKRFLGRFVLVGTVALPFFVLDIWGSAVRWSGWPDFDNLALPVFLLILDALILLEAREWTAQPVGPVEVEPMVGLTQRESEIARRILEGASAKEIAAALELSPKTVENHTYRIFQKVGVRSRLQFYHRFRDGEPRH